MLAPSPLLQWRENGPGIGRDARTAYSSLLGRYMARAYLHAVEGVRILVPLDTARNVLRGSSYRVGQPPPSQGFEADWIGLDARQRLIIAEAKGSSDKSVGTWRGPNSIPQVLRNATEQAQRTQVYRNTLTTPLPAKRWAVASRWSNEHNDFRPTLLAWDPDEGPLDNEDYQALAKLLHRADVHGVLNGLGHPEAAEVVNAVAPTSRLSGDIGLLIGDRHIEPGFAAVLGPIGLLSLRGRDDLDQLRRIREVNPDVAVASFSTRYASTILDEPRVFDEDHQVGLYDTAPDDPDRFAKQAGLTIVWPTPEEDIALSDD